MSSPPARLQWVLAAGAGATATEICASRLLALSIGYGLGTAAPPAP